MNPAQNCASRGENFCSTPPSATGVRQNIGFPPGPPEKNKVAFSRGSKSYILAERQGCQLCFFRGRGVLYSGGHRPPREVARSVFRCRPRAFSQSKKSSCWRRRHLEELRPTQGEAAETPWAYRFLPNLDRKKRSNAKPWKVNRPRRCTCSALCSALEAHLGHT